MSSPYVAPSTEPIPRTGFRDPATLALIAFPLAVLCLFGGGLLTGVSYTVAFADTSGGQDQFRWYAFAGAIVSALFASVPYVLARYALGRLVSSDAWWIVPLLRAAYVLAGIAVLLNLVMAVIGLFDEEYGISSLFIRRL